MSESYEREPRTQYRAYGIDGGETEPDAGRWHDTLQDAVDDAQRWLADVPKRDTVGVQCRNVWPVESCLILRRHGEDLRVVRR